MLDNIRSIYNVGAMLRTADGAGVRRVYLAGMTATPEHPKVRKTALGAETAVPWVYAPNALETAVALQQHGVQIWALEATAMAQDVFSLGETTAVPILLVVGNERAGVDPGILAMCDRTLALPMLGQKESLNAAVAFGVALYALQFG